jgi:hypothetical protein
MGSDPTMVNVDKLKSCIVYLIHSLIFGVKQINVYYIFYVKKRIKS